MPFVKIPRAGWVGLMLGMVLSATILFVASETGAQQQRQPQQQQQRALLNRNWTCHAEIQLQGHTHPAYVPASWPMSGRITVDRERACRSFIQGRWLDGSIWSLLNLPPSIQNAVCAAGSGSFRIDYGFDQRRKNWNFTQSVPAPPCNCPMSCPAGYSLDDTGQRCHRALCSNVAHPNQNFIDANNNGVFIWSGTLYQMVAATQSSSGCTFR